MNRDQLSIRVARQLQSESLLLDELQNLCDQFSAKIQPFSSTAPSPLDLRADETILASFVAQTKQVTESRRQILALINEPQPNGGTIGIRQFIRTAPQSHRAQLEKDRGELVTRMNSIRSQVAGDSAVVFYSFDFYRRIVNGLVNCIAEEQHYKPNGKSAAQNSGQLFRKVC